MWHWGNKLHQTSLSANCCTEKCKHKWLRHLTTTFVACHLFLSPPYFLSSSLPSLSNTDKKAKQKCSVCVGSHLHSPGTLQDPCSVLQPCLQIAAGRQRETVSKHGCYQKNNMNFLISFSSWLCCHGCLKIPTSTQAFERNNRRRFYKQLHHPTTIK